MALKEWLQGIKIYIAVSIQFPCMFDKTAYLATFAWLIKQHKYDSDIHIWCCLGDKSHHFQHLSL